MSRRPPRRSKPGPVCSVCRHPGREAIDLALIQGESPPRIAAKYRRLSDDAVRRHATSHLPAQLAKAAEAAKSAGAERLIGQLERCLELVNLLLDACDRWLRDPDDPTRYEIGPRAEDVMVTYLVPSGKKQVRKKARLSQLLAKVEEVAPGVEFYETKHADPRHLILSATKRLDGHTELLARLLGELKDSPGITVNVVESPQWVALRTVLLQALQPYPAARLAVTEALGQYAGR